MGVIGLTRTPRRGEGSEWDRTLLCVFRHALCFLVLSWRSFSSGTITMVLFLLMVSITWELVVGFVLGFEKQLYVFGVLACAFAS